MRRLCADLLRGLRSQDTSSPAALFTALCDGMSRRNGRPVSHRLVKFPAGTVSGLWIATATRHLVLCEQDTAPEHQLVIIGHEFWHLETHQGLSDTADAAEAARLLTPDVSSATVERIARRSTLHTHDQQEEAACEYFGSLLGSRAWPLLSSAAAEDTPPTSGLVHRIETSLSPRRPAR